MIKAIPPHFIYRVRGTAITSMRLLHECIQYAPISQHWATTKNMPCNGSAILHTESKNMNTALLRKHLFAYKMQHKVKTTLLSSLTNRKDCGEWSTLVAIKAHVRGCCLGIETRFMGKTRLASKSRDCRIKVKSPLSK